MKKRTATKKKYNAAFSNTTVVQTENYRIDRIREGDHVEFSVYIDGVWMADRDTLPEAQTWRDEYVYSQLQHSAAVAELLGRKAA